MYLINYHTHTIFCDGSDEPELYIKEAIKQGMHSLGFSSHAPVSFENQWSIKNENLDNYCKTIHLLKEKYQGQINIHLSLEIDFIHGVTYDFDKLVKNNKLEYTIGSVHLVSSHNKSGLWFIDGPEDDYIRDFARLFDGNIQKAVKTYYKQICEMIVTQKPTIIGHLDKVKMNNKNRFFSEDEDWYKKIVSDTLRVIKNSDCILEVNTRGIYKGKTKSLFPGVEILEQCYMLGIPLTISSDAHSPSELTNFFKETIIILKDIGYKGIYVFDKNKWELHPF